MFPVASSPGPFAVTLLASPWALSTFTSKGLFEMCWPANRTETWRKTASALTHGAGAELSSTATQPSMRPSACMAQRHKRQCSGQPKQLYLSSLAGCRDQTSMRQAMASLSKNLLLQAPGSRAGWRTFSVKPPQQTALSAKKHLTETTWLSSVPLWQATKLVSWAARSGPRWEESQLLHCLQTWFPQTPTHVLPTHAHPPPWKGGSPIVQTKD